jgi:hypothetical protein
MKFEKLCFQLGMVWAVGSSLSLVLIALFLFDSHIAPLAILGGWSDHGSDPIPIGRTLDFLLFAGAGLVTGYCLLRLVRERQAN